MRQQELVQDRNYTQAKAALDRAAWSVGSMRARLHAEETLMSVRYCAVARCILNDLENMYCALSATWRDMLANDVEELSPRWWKFLECYDDFREAERQAKVELICEELHQCPAGQSIGCPLRFRCPVLEIPGSADCPVRHDAS